MAYSTTNLYPEDLNGNLPSNLITGEVQTLQVPGPTDFYFIIPKAAPFFVDSLVVLNHQTGVKYVEGDDYLIGHRFIEAMDSIGRPIAGSIRFMKTSIIGQVRLTYRTVGGQWGFSDAAILKELSNKQYNPLVRSWGDIDVLPASFPPLAHDQRVDSLIGSEEINDSLQRIGDILEAVSEGVNKSHLTDYNNPHKTNATQVGVGNVPNFKMATDAEHQNPTSPTLFTNPAGVFLMIQGKALAPLNAHINATGNVHGLQRGDIGLDKVPNYPAASPEQATDPTNNTTLLTPYLANLLIQRQQTDPRLDQLINDFNNHLTADNPHRTTPAGIGTYTSQEIDQKIKSASQGDSLSFGGLTPDEWVALFPANADVNTILNELYVQVDAGTTLLSGLDLTDPLKGKPAGSDDDTQSHIATWGFAQYQAFAVYNAFNNGRVTGATPTKVGGAFQTGVLPDAVAHWASLRDANYAVQPDGSIKAWGASSIAIPTGFATGSGFVAANAVDGIWATAQAVYARKVSDKLVYVLRAGQQPLQTGFGDSVSELHMNNGMVDPRVFGVSVTDGGSQGDVFSSFGDTSWMTAFNNVKSALTAQGQSIVDCQIGTAQMVLVTNDAAGVGRLRIYTIGYTATMTLTEATSSINIFNHQTQTNALANTLTGFTGVFGTFDHFMLFMKNPLDSTGRLNDLYSMGDATFGQRAIPAGIGPYVGVMAGSKFTVTIDRNHRIDFWGDVGDNSLRFPFSSIMKP